VAEPVKPTRTENKTHQHTDRPRYEPPMVIHLGNSHQGRGGEVCQPGSGDLFNCLNGPGFQAD
jgi:hypothetical protein